MLSLWRVSYITKTMKKKERIYKQYRENREVQNAIDKIVYCQYINIQVECSCMESYINKNIPFENHEYIYIECRQCGEDIILKTK